MPGLSSTVGRMAEVTSISASSYDPESLAPMLDEKVSEGWEIVSIVSAGTRVVAYLQREGGGVASAAVVEEAPVEETSAVDEPAGWGAAPEQDDIPAAAAGAVAAATVATQEPAAEQPAPQAMPAQEPVQQQEPVQPESTVPAGWYADPSSRYELRYWDGNQWTEHVSRAGQQYTDPPVA